MHLDQNEYYGGEEAAVSLPEAEAWVDRFAAAKEHARFSHASITRTDGQDDTDKPRLASARAYSLSLAPQLIYARSALVPAIVSSRTHNQVDFQAVGSWFLVDHDGSGSTTLTRVPSSREGVFQDKSLDLKARRPLMKFLMFVKDEADKLETWEEYKDTPFPAFLQQKFRLQPTSHGPILALTMSDKTPESTTTGYVVPRIARHLRSIGVFGPGFGAVLPKWGGLAEIAQVACRACAVGGGVYVLNKGIKEAERQLEGGSISLELSGSEKVSTTRLVGGQDDMPTSLHKTKAGPTSTTASSRSISIVSSPLTSLFPPTSEGGVTPAGAVVVVIPSAGREEPPVHILVHTSDAGECPMNQCKYLQFLFVCSPLRRLTCALMNLIFEYLSTLSELY